MEAFIMLCDAAQRDSATGKVHVIGGDWSSVGSNLHAMAIAVFLRIPWSEADQEHPFVLRLLDAHRNPVIADVENTDEQHPIQFTGKMQAASATTLTAEDPLRQVDIHSSLVASVMLPPDTLKPGLYTWVLEVSDTELSSVAFVVHHS